MSYGSISHILSSKDIKPLSINLHTANPVNSLVPDAIPKAVSVLLGNSSLLLRKPLHFSKITPFSSADKNTPENLFASFQFSQIFLMSILFLSLFIFSVKIKYSYTHLVTMPH